MELSTRLQAVADFVTAGYKLADIGTDHAYIPIALVEQNRIPGAIAMDINEGPLQRAGEHIAENKMEKKIEIRLSNGFSALKKGEAESAVIAGMGGGLMIRILTEGEQIAKSLKECILQPQSEIERVRRFLLEEGYDILDENMVKDDGKYYTILKVCPLKKTSDKEEESWEEMKSNSGKEEKLKSGKEIKSGKRTEMWSEPELKYGRFLLQNRNPVLREYLQREILIREQILAGLDGKENRRIEQRRTELKKELENMGEKPFRAEQIFKWIFQEKVKSFDEMTNISLELREKLKQNYTICNFEILRKQESKDGTIKYLFDVLDGNAIETVLMSYHHGYSICVSSQIGCKMGCKFCASTGINFIRNLSSGEIVEQILAVERDNGIKISNVVFMGIGEPLNNYNNVVNAIRIINNPKGINIGARHISVSTSGLVPGIYRLADENIQCTLSISLHATNNKKRSSMMPVNNAFPIEELLQACKDYIAKTNRRISFEYALAKDNNDNLEDAKELVHLLRGMLCHVNLIPINKIENGAYSKSSNENIMQFRDYLNDHGIVATIRRELGSDIDAACGQLRRKNL